MENATKALLIAGSILVVILLIAFAMRILNPAADTIDSSKTAMETTDMATFNSKFTQYAGSNKSAAQVKALANVVIANNATNEQRKVSFEGKTSSNDIINLVADYNGSYTIKVLDNDADGFVDTIDIQ